MSFSPKMWRRGNDPLHPYLISVIIITILFQVVVQGNALCVLHSRGVPPLKPFKMYIAIIITSLNNLRVLHVATTLSARLINNHSMMQIKKLCANETTMQYWRSQSYETSSVIHPCSTNFL